MWILISLLLTEMKTQPKSKWNEIYTAFESNVQFPIHCQMKCYKNMFMCMKVNEVFRWMLGEWERLWIWWMMWWSKTGWYVQETSKVKIWSEIVSIFRKLKVGCFPLSLCLLIYYSLLSSSTLISHFHVSFLHTNYILHYTTYSYSYSLLQNRSNDTIEIRFPVDVWKAAGWCIEWMHVTMWLWYCDETVSRWNV